MRPINHNQRTAFGLCFCLFALSFIVGRFFGGHAAGMALYVVSVICGAFGIALRD